MDLNLRRILVDEDQAEQLRLLAGSQSPNRIGGTDSFKLGRKRRLNTDLLTNAELRSLEDEDIQSGTFGQSVRGIGETFLGTDPDPLVSIRSGFDSFFRGGPSNDEYGNPIERGPGDAGFAAVGGVLTTAASTNWLKKGAAALWKKAGSKVGAAPGAKLLAKTARKLQTEVVALAKEGKGAQAAKELVEARKEIKAWTKALDEAGNLSEKGKQAVEEALEETKKTVSRAKGKFYTEKAVEKVDDVAGKADDLLGKVDDAATKADDVAPKIDLNDIPTDPVKAKGFFSKRWDTIKGRKIKGNILPALNLLTSAILLKDGLDWVQESILGSPDKDLRKAAGEQKKLLEDTPLVARQREREQQSEAENVRTAAAGLDQIARKILLQRKAYAPSFMSMVAPQTEDDVIDHAARNEIIKSLIAGNKAELQSAKQEADR